jgi:hypothetical protein
VKLGVLLPTFRDGAKDAFARASEAAAAGIDGVFAYDHLWPMGSPERPSLAPFGLLSVSRVATVNSWWVHSSRASASWTTSTCSTVPDAHTLAPGRVIAALGTGDKLSAAGKRSVRTAGFSGESDVELVARRRDGAGWIHAHLDWGRG